MPLQVRRVLTDTPLARLHEHRLAGRGGKRAKPIPFSAFDRTKYPAPALALATDAQTKLALGEYGAVDLFAWMASAMTANAVPFDLVAATARIPADEIRHADFALQMATLLAGREVSLRVEASALGHAWKNDFSQETLDRMVAEISAVGETLACALLSACMTRAKDRTLRALFSAIVADEVHHARVGWYYLAWRAPRWSQAERQRVADHVGRLVVSVEKRFWRGRDAAPAARRAARALGVLESEGQRDAVREVMENEIVPGLDALGLGASHAWRMRQRGA
jgi:rubrerythrin